MARPTIRRRHTDLQLESVARITSLPIVESGMHIANSVYDKIKRSNSLMFWSLDTAEQSLALATATAMPTMIALNIPIMTIDQLLCRGIDIVEQRVPAVHLSPHLMYWNTREYVNNKFVKPVLIRADSVKLIGSQAASAAVDRLAGAIDVADQYVDHYLPPDPADQIAESDVTDSAKRHETSSANNGNSNSSKAVRTIEHGARFSRKLQRRLTRRTFAEARALKEQGTECIHVLLYVAELVATDPKLAMQKAKELWASLSLPEPENQARPTNLEQLLVLFTRETARRIVHLVNGMASLAARSPRRLGRALLHLSHRLASISEQALKVTHQLVYRLLANGLLLLSLVGRPRRAAARPKARKLHFHTANGGPAALEPAAPGPNRLSLIAKIDLVPLSRRSSSSSAASAAPSLVEENGRGAGDDDSDSSPKPNNSVPHNGESAPSDTGKAPPVERN